MPAKMRSVPAKLLSMVHIALQSIAALPLLSFGQALGKLQGKVVTRLEDLG